MDALYAGRTQQYIETQVKFEDGRTGSVSATLKLMDTKSSPARQERRLNAPGSNQ